MVEDSEIVFESCSEKPRSTFRCEDATTQSALLFAKGLIDFPRAGQKVVITGVATCDQTMAWQASRRADLFPFKRVEIGRSGAQTPVDERDSERALFGAWKVPKRLNELNYHSNTETKCQNK